MSKKIRNIVSLFVWFVSYFFALFLSKIFLSISVNYEDKSFKEIKKPVIVVSNHKNSFDPWVIFVSLPFCVFLNILPVRPFAKKKFKNNSFLGLLSSLKIIGFVYYIYNVITIPDVDSFEGKTQPLVDALDKKNSLLFFPEGKMVLEEEVGEFKRGVVYLQEVTNTPILPCAVRYGKKGWFRRKTFVSFGKVFYTPEEMLKNKEDYSEAREHLRREIKRLYQKKIF